MDVTSKEKNSAAFWQNKKVLITGHTGFKGAWLTLWLEMLGAKIIAYAQAPNTKPNLFSLANIQNNILHIEADIRDYAKLSAIIKKHEPEIIFHLAAQSLVRYSYKHPLATYETNVLGVAYLLEAAKNSASVKAIVNVTSDKCYENFEWQRAYHENDQLGGHDPYSSSKACAELITNAYRKSFFQIAQHKVGLASARAGNVIGGGDWAEDRLIPDIFRAYENNVPVQIRNLNATRPWQHVLEPLSAYLTLAEKLYKEPNKYSDAFNFGPTETDIKTVEWVVNELMHLLGPDAKWELNPEKGPHEAFLLKLDCTKAKEILDWGPRTNLKHGLKKTVEWYHAYLAGNAMREYTQKQIKEFMEHRVVK